jgi:hypothetical protein
MVSGPAVAPGATVNAAVVGVRVKFGATTVTLTAVPAVEPA